MKKVLLVNLNWRELKKLGRMRKFDPVIPLELLYISASMDKEKIENELIDLWAINKNIDDFRNFIKNSDIIIITTAPGYIFWRDGTIDAELSRRKFREIKKINPSINIIVVGPHGTVIPNTFFDDPVDFIVRGEPDLITSKLVKQIRRNKKITINSVCYKKNGKWIIGKKYANVDNLSKLPLIPYEKTNINNYTWPIGPRDLEIKRRTIYEASRGCPFNCVFCFRAGFRGKFRKKTLSQIKKELDKLSKLNLDYVYFIDELFGIDLVWTKNVCKEIKKRNLKWGCELRPEFLDKERTDVMADGGCVSINIGLESANRSVLKAIGKATIDLERLKENVFYAVKKGIHIKIFCTAGSPLETKETLNETLKYISQFPLNKVHTATNLMLPYPGTLLWKLGLKEGKKLKDWNDIKKYSGIIGNKFRNPKEVLKEVAKFNAKVLREQSRLTMMNGLKNGNFPIMFKFLIIYFACNVLILFPELFNTFYKFYRFV